jgi:hypothetical protein
VIGRKVSDRVHTGHPLPLAVLTHGRPFEEMVPNWLGDAFEQMWLGSRALRLGTRSRCRGPWGDELCERLLGQAMKRRWAIRTGVISDFTCWYR